MRACASFPSSAAGANSKYFSSSLTASAVRALLSAQLARLNVAEALPPTLPFRSLSALHKLALRLALILLCTFAVTLVLTGGGPACTGGASTSGKDSSSPPASSRDASNPTLSDR